MTASAGDSQLFDRDVLTETAAEYGLEEEFLEELVYRHQESIEALPGIENMVYEWRKHFAAPVIERTEAAYYLAIPEAIWDEFADSLDIDSPEQDALVDVHRRTVGEQTDVALEPEAGQAYIALDRYVDSS